jgi:eukaryotic-like serine/threonine-protein kinase
MSESGIFKAAVNLPPDRRAAYLEEACGSDAELRGEIDSLLRAHDTAGSFLEDDSAGCGPTAIYEPIIERPGTVIGPYKLMEQIGEGGFGLVFVAEQQHPMRRKVALKIIKPGMDTRDIIARFEAERQALALMDHSNIAQVLDAGTTENGRPYFVMELVKGIPIVDYCDREQLTTRDRLDLFLSVCQAVQHAHSKGIIHRDLKPSNILVAPHDLVPVVKVIDFGIAKAIGQRLTEKTIYTRFTQMIGTPLYMSPEQAEVNALDVDIRSDVYSLGVLLYELLTGTTPFDRERFATASYDEIRRIIREEDPPKPSTRLSMPGAALSTVSTQRRTEPTKLSALVKGDLDWIVMKALEKDRSRRYETASALAADVRRFMNEEPVEARPPSTWYRFGKLARRNKVALLTATLVATALVLGTAVSLWQAVRAIRAEARAKNEADHATVEANRAIRADQQARAERDRALTAEAQTRAEADKFKAINEFLTTDLLTQAEPANNAVEDHVTLLEVLDRAAAKVGRRFAGQPELESALRVTIAQTYHGLASWEKAEAQCRSRLDAARQRDPQSAEFYQALAELAHILGHRGRHDAEVMQMVKSAANGLQRTLGPDHPQALNALDNLAGRYQDAGKLVEAIALYERVRDALIAELGPNDPQTLNTLNNLALAYLRAGKLTEAIALFERVRDARIAKLEPDHLETLKTLNNLALAYLQAGKLTEAIALFERVRDARIAKLGPDHPETLVTLNNLAGAYRGAGKLPEAIALFERVRDAKIANLEPDHPSTLTTLDNLAVAYDDAGKLTEAIALFERVRHARIAQYGPDHPETLTTLNHLAGAYRRAGKLKEAIALFERVRDARTAQLGPDDPNTLDTLNGLAAAYWSVKQLDKSVPLFEDVLKRREAKFGRQHPQTLMTVADLGVNYKDSGRLNEAIPLLEEAHHASGKFPRLRWVGAPLLEAYAKAGRSAEAVKLVPKLLADDRKKSPNDSPQLAGALAQFGLTLLQVKAYADAEPLLRECLAIREKTQPDLWNTFTARSMLGGALLGQKKYADAGPLLIAGYEGMKRRETTIPPRAKGRLTEALERLVQLYVATDKPDEAARWHEELESAKAVQSSKPAKRR